MDFNEIPNWVRKNVTVDPNGCWVYSGTLDRAGYGKIWFAGRSHLLHRWLYEVKIGPVSFGLELDHLCRNRSCCNPAHLEQVTHRENILRGVSPPALCALKTHCPKGHEYLPDNTIHWRGTRRCLTCRREQYRQADLNRGRRRSANSH